ncbi:potassium transporter TrkG, partial [Thermus scotoductus]
MKPWPVSSARQGFRSSLYLLGLTYQGFGLLMLAFALLALGWGEDARGFLLGTVLG